MTADPPGVALGAADRAAQSVLAAADQFGLRGLSEPAQIMVILSVEFGLMILVSLCCPRKALSTLEPFYARLHTPVGKEADVCWDDAPDPLPESATLGLEGTRLDYRKSSRFAYAGLQRLGIELPRFTLLDISGFLAAWGLVGALIVLLIWLAGLR
jgi:hypothetical protein